MKKAFKKIGMVAMTIIAATSFILLFAENADGSFNLAWTMGCLVALTGSGKILDKMGAFK